MANISSVGHVIRDLRRAQNLTGEELGKKVGVSQSKISKIESGSNAELKIDQIDKILNILDAQQTIRQQVKVALGSSNTVKVQRYNTVRPYMETLDQEKKSRNIRTFTIGMVPALLQTVEYQEALYKRREIPAKALQQRLRINARRQDLLWDKRRRYHLIMLESALYTMVGNDKVQLAQLDRVERLSELSNI